MQSRVTLEMIVKNLHVLKDIHFSLCSSLVMEMIRQLRFQGAEETFHQYISVTVAVVAQTSTYLILGQQSLIIVVGILTLPIQVMQQARWWLTYGDCYLQCGYNHIAFQPVVFNYASPSFSMLNLLYTY